MTREDGLVCFEGYSIVDFIVFVKVDPCSVRTRFAVVAVDNDPLVVLNTSDVALSF